MEVRELCEQDIPSCAALVAQFRVELKSLKGIVAQPDAKQGEAELFEYLDKGFPVYMAEEGGALLGYAVCKTDDGVVWLESIFTAPGARRRGVAKALFERAERLAAEYGEPTVYNWVHPNNEKMLAFLKKRGYNVLNLIEVRKAYEGEALTRKIPVGERTFDY
ncbi:MAG: GNAT family N-acetyltransferase [Clostridiaceae bacterium]|nr:GNAT family N-acetyltransferase [Eubacteriales bacterium]